MTAEVLGPRALNRATAARQLLLERSAMPVVDVVRHLVGLQAQNPLDPYLGLWSRLEGFDPAALGARLLDRSLVRIVGLRTTIHLLTADDCLELRPLAQPLLDRELTVHRDHKGVLTGLDLAPVLAHARPFLSERPRTGPQLRAELAAQFPDLPAAALALACRNKIPLVQVPPRGVWGQRAQVTLTTADSWLGRSVATEPSVDTVVLRYLSAFGPATAADVRTWSGLTGLREVLDRLRPELRTFRDEDGRELFDLPDAPRPDPDVPAPPRLLPMYDNLLLSHADRRRFASDEARTRLSAGQRDVRGSVLHDGALVGTWRLDDERLVVDHVGVLPARARAAIAEEAMRAAWFTSPDRPQTDVRFEAVD